MTALWAAGVSPGEGGGGAFEVVAGGAGGGGGTFPLPPTSVGMIKTEVKVDESDVVDEEESELEVRVLVVLEKRNVPLPKNPGVRATQLRLVWSRPGRCDVECLT